MLSAFLGEPRIASELASAGRRADGANLGSGRTVYSVSRQPVSQPSSTHPANRVGRPSPCFSFLPRPCHAVLTQGAQARRSHATDVRSPTHTETGRRKKRGAPSVPSVTCVSVPSVCAQCVAVVRVHSVPSAQVTSRCARAGHGNGRSNLSPCPAVSFPPAPSVSIRLHPSNIINPSTVPNIITPHPQPQHRHRHRITIVVILPPAASTHRPPSIARPPPPSSILSPHTSDLRSIRFSPLGPRPWCDFILHPTEPRFSRLPLLRPSWHGLCSSTATASALDHGSM